MVVVVVEIGVVVAVAEEDIIMTVEVVVIPVVDTVVEEEGIIRTLNNTIQDSNTTTHKSNKALIPVQCC